MGINNYAAYIDLFRVFAKLYANSTNYYRGHQAKKIAQLEEDIKHTRTTDSQEWLAAMPTR